MINKSNEYGDETNLDLVETKHPLVKAFNGKSLVYEDEPYIFKGAYEELKFRPLLRMDTTKLKK